MTPGVTTAADFDLLTTAGKPYLFVVSMTERDATGLARATRVRAPDSALVTVLRGRKMVTEDGLYDEFAAALQFPYYFGENWDALSECLADLSWLPAPGHVVVITSAPQLLTAAVERALSVFVRLLERVAAGWSSPQPLLRDQDVVPFHVVFQAQEAEVAPLLDRLQGAGAEVGVLAWPGRP